MVLVIIGDPKIRNAMVEKVLEPLGFEAIVAADKKQGLELSLLQAHDLILVDTRAITPSTHSMVSILRQSNTSTPIILVSNSKPEGLIEAFRSGITDHIPLPLTAADAQKIIIRVLERSEHLAEREKSNQKLVLDEAVRITLTTLSHYLNNYLTALNGDLILLSESIQNNDRLENQMEILKKGQRDAACIKKVIEVLVNTTSIKLTEYDGSARMIDIDASLVTELSDLLDVSAEDEVHG